MMQRILGSSQDSLTAPIFSRSREAAPEEEDIVSLDPEGDADVDFNKPMPEDETRKCKKSRSR